MFHVPRVSNYSHRALANIVCFQISVTRAAWINGWVPVMPTLVNGWS